MKIKQTIKKIEEGCGKKFQFEKDKMNIYTCGKFYSIFGKEILCLECKEKLSGYKLALKDVLGEIDVLQTKIDKNKSENIMDTGYVRACNSAFDTLEELKKPIQEILKDRIEVLK